MARQKFPGAHWQQLNDRSPNDFAGQKDAKRCTKSLDAECSQRQSFEKTFALLTTREPQMKV